jgi:crossover junction endodeoxyribonuclease RuvC
MGAVFERGYLWYEVVRRFVVLGVPVREIGQQVLKTYMLGRGVGTKGAMIDAAARRLPQFETRGDDNAADAVAACALAAELLGLPLCAMPKTHLAAVDAANGVGKSRRRKAASKSES